MNFQKNPRPLHRSARQSIEPSQRLASLKELMQLEEERAGLEITLNTLNTKINVLHSALIESTRARPLRFRLKDQGRAPSNNGHRRMGRGELRTQILERLTQAGDKGVLVHDLAQELGLKAVNIHSWFHTALKRFPQIKKTGPSHYQLAGVLAADLQSTASKPTAQGKTTDRIPAKRGEVTQRILQVLETVGDAGISVSELAKRTGSTYRNIHVWLSSTGKRNLLVARTARGTYKMVPSQGVREGH